LQEFGDIDPQGVVLHFQGAVKLEALVLQMEVEAGKGLGVAIEELGGASPG